MSEHEGFGVPLVESMLLDVPVLAYRAGAVPGTLGGAGVLFDEKRLDEVAEMASRLAARRPAARRRAAGAGAPARGLRPARGGGGAEGLRGLAVSAPRRRSPSSSSATAPEITGGSESLARAVAERLAAVVRDHRLHDLRARLRDLAQRAAGGGVGAGRRARPPLPGRGGARPRRLQPLLGRAVPARRGRTRRRSSGCAGRARSPPASSRRWARRGRASTRSSSSPTSTTRRTGAWQPRPPRAASSCPPRTTSRRCGSASTTRSSRARAPLPSSPRRRRRSCAARFDLGDRPAARRRHGRRRARPPPDVAAFRRRFDVDAALRRCTPAASTPARAARRWSRTTRATARRGGSADLLLIGTLAMELPPVPGLRHLGYLSEEDKHAALAAAAVVVCPSVDPGLHHRSACGARRDGRRSARCSRRSRPSGPGGGPAHRPGRAGRRARRCRRPRPRRRGGRRSS